MVAKSIPAFEQVDRRRVAEGVRVDALAAKGCHRVRAPGEMLPEQVSHTEARQLRAVAIDEERAVGVPAVPERSTRRRSLAAVCAQIGQTRILPPLPRSRTW